VLPTPCHTTQEEGAVEVRAPDRINLG